MFTFQQSKVVKLSAMQVAAMGYKTRPCKRVGCGGFVFKALHFKVEVF